MIAAESRIYTGVYPIGDVSLIREGVNVAPFSRFEQDIYYKIAIAAKATTASPFILNAGIEYGFVIASIGWAIFSDEGAFLDFKQGDIVTLVRPSTTNRDYTVLSVSKDGNLLVLNDTPFGSSPVNTNSTNVAISLKLSALNIDYVQTINSNLEAENFNSFANNTPEIKRALNVSVTVPLIDVTGSSANKITSNYQVNYLTNQINSEGIWEAEILVTPATGAQSYANVFWRDGEIDNINSLSPPDRMFNDEQIFITRLSIQQVGAALKRDFNFTNNEYNTEIYYFNKKIDGSETGIRIEDLQIENVVTGLPSTGVEIGGNSFVSFKLISSDIALVDLATKLNFCLLPVADEYKNNDRTQKRNFCIDELVLEADPSPSPNNGENFASGYGALTNIIFEKIDDFEYEISFNIDFASSTHTNQLAAAYQNKKALLSINTFGADETCVVIGLIDVLINPNPPTEIISFSEINYYSHTDLFPVTMNIEATTEEEFVIKKNILIDTETFTDASKTKIVNLKQKLIAKNIVTGESFDLDIVEFNPSASIIYKGADSQIQIINLNSSRPYTFNEGWLKDIQLTTDINAFKEDETIGVINLKVPSQIRWEYYLRKIGVNTDFYNPSVPNDGMNENFYRYNSALENWKIYERTEVQCQFINPTSLQVSSTVYSNENLIEINDYSQNDSYTTKNIKTYNGATEITPNITNYDKTKIVATFENVEDLTENVVVIRAYIFENGTVRTVQHYSSYFETPENSNFFISTDGSKKVKVTNLADNKIEAECYIDGTRLTGVQKITIAAWVMKVVDYRYQFEDGEFFDFEDGIQYDFQH